MPDFFLYKFLIKSIQINPLQSNHGRHRQSGPRRLKIDIWAPPRDGNATLCGGGMLSHGVFHSSHFWLKLSNLGSVNLFSLKSLCGFYGTGRVGTEPLWTRKKNKVFSFPRKKSPVNI